MNLNLSHRYRQLKKIATSRTARNSSILFISNAVTSMLSIFAIIIVSRTLGPEKFGVVTIFNSIWLTIATLTDFGLGTSAVKFIASHLGSDKHKAAVYMRVIFQLELLIGLLIGVFGFLFSYQISELLGGQHLITAVRLGLLAGMFVSASAFLGPFLMAFEKFKKLAIVNIIGATYRIVGIVLLLSLVVINVNNVMLLYTTVPFLLFVIALFVTPKDYTQPMAYMEQKAAFGEIFHFTKWIFLSTIAAVAFGRLDVFIIARLKGTTEVGLYGAAIQLSNFFPLIIGAIGGAILPWVSKLKTKSELVKYIKKSTTGVFFISLLLLPVFFISEPLIELVFGNKFSGSIGAFKLIFPGYMLNLLTSAMALVFYATDKPKIITFINYTQLVVMVAIDIIFIPHIGLYGAALGFLVSQVLGAIMIVLFVKKTIKSIGN